MTQTRLRIVICTEDQDATSQGIHLHQPDAWALTDAVERAERDGFNRIYAHYPTLRQGKVYKIHADALAALFELAREHSIKVITIDPTSLGDGD